MDRSWLLVPLPIATSLCPDELDDGDEDAADEEEDEEAKDILPWSSMYLVLHFPQKQDINQFKWRAMKFVERGGTTRRNLVCVHVFENHSASHLPSRPPPTPQYWGDPRHPQKGSIVRYLVALVEIPTLRAILFRG